MTNNFQNLTVQDVLNNYTTGGAPSIPTHTGVVTLPLDSVIFISETAALALTADSNVENNGIHTQIMNYVIQNYGQHDSNHGYIADNFAHIYASAYITFNGSVDQAIYAGNLNEIRPNNTVESASADQYDNFLGRAIGKYLKDNGHELSVENIGDVIQRFNEEGLIINGSLDLENKGFVFTATGIFGTDILSAQSASQIHSDIINFLESRGLETNQCFLAGTQITMFDGTTKNIEDITADDIVMSYDETGKLVPGRVTKTFQNQVKHILNVHGLMITPGHVTLCGDGAFKGQHVPMIDIIRSDGAVVKTDGTPVRVNTNCAVGSYEDQFVLLAIGEMGKDGLHVRDQGRVRIGSRFILPDGRDMSIAEILAASGATVNDDGLVVSDTMPEPTPLHLSFLDAMPQVEDYILAHSGLSLDEIYDAGEWEATRPQMPAPMGVKRRPSRAEVLKAEANYKSPPRLH